MSILALLTAAHASAAAFCGASLLEGPGTRVRVSCEGSSSAPGGPVHRFAVPAPAGPLTLRLRGVEIATLVREQTNEDGSAVFAADLELAPGLMYLLGGPDPVSVHPLRAGPDATLLLRCTTNPDTCADTATKVPEALGPELRLQACMGRYSCREAREDPMTERTRGMLELSCISFNEKACAWLGELDPSVPWGWVSPTPPGTGKRVATGIRFVLQPEPLGIGWTDEVPPEPLVSADVDDTVRTVRLANGLTARWDAKGLVLLEGRKEVWRWRVDGIDGVAVRPDGQQLLVRRGRMVAWVSFDNMPMPAFVGFPEAPRGKPVSGTLIRPDGWPAAGTVVSAPCDADDTEYRCRAVVDLKGGFYLAGMHGSRIRVEGPHVGEPRETVIVDGLPARIPDGDRVFDFEVDGDGRVLRASEPLQPGDVVVTLGPLPVDREIVQDGGRWLTGVPRADWAALASAWGSVEVVRAGERLTLR